jgi:arylsulfatase A-like enzyme
MKSVLSLGVLLLALGTNTLAGESRPNLLVLFTDDQRMDTLGCYNTACPIETPNLDRLAEQGVRFTNGFVTTPICSVSRACLITGRYESNHGMHRFHEELRDEVFEHTYPVYLKKAGYFVGNFGKFGIGISNGQKKWFDVFDGQASQGPPFRDYKGKKVHDAEWLTLKTIEFLDQVPEGQPFCLQLNYKEPHFSSEPAPEDLGALKDHVFPRSPMDTREQFERLPELVRTGFSRACYDDFFGKNGNHRYLSDYFEKIMSVERSVGKIMGLLEDRGLADNTVIIFLSDHGTHFGEKQIGGKWTPYEESLRIPFIVYDPRPGAQKGAVSDKMVLNTDVAPTLLDLAGVEVPDVMDGRSLVPLVTSASSLVPGAWRTEFFFEHFHTPAPPRQIARNEGVRSEGFKYLRWTDLGEVIEEFYDLKNDPAESRNLISSPEYGAAVEKARKTFLQWREETPVGDIFKTYSKQAAFGAMEIDWKRFEEAHPEAYQKIAVEVERLGVTWEQAVNDWKIRKAICKKAEYWY